MVKRDVYSFSVVGIVLIIAVVAIVFVLTTNNNNYFPNTPIIPGNIKGMAYTTNNIPLGYGTPYDPGATISFYTLSATNIGAKTNITLQINKATSFAKMYTYNTAYYTTGTSWVPITLSTSTWIPDSFTNTFQIDTPSTTQEYNVIIYTCKKYNLGDQYYCGYNNTIDTTKKSWTVQNINIAQTTTSTQTNTTTPPATQTGTAVTYIYLNDISITTPGNSPTQVTYQITPSNALATDLIWSTSAGSDTNPGTIGGSTAYGTVSASGIYTPPNNPTIGTHIYKVWAVSKANANIHDYCYVNITSTSTTTPTITTVAISPSATSINTGAQTQFTALVSGTGSYTNTVTWTALRGTISSSGVYTAPTTAGTDTITARSTQDNTKTTTASITVNNGKTATSQSNIVGFGYATTGGTGKTVVHVTNLNDEGPGSFRAAIGSNRIIVFDVSGTIDVTSNEVYFNDCSNVTIDGSTAPGSGITFTNLGIWFIRCNNIIIKNIRHRGGNILPIGGEGDPIGFQFSSNVLVDHCSLSGTTDETISWWNTNTDITMQNCLLGPGWYPNDAGHNYAVTFGQFSDHITFYHNLFTGSTHRNPELAWDAMGESQTATTLTGEVINNVIWKYQSYGTNIYSGSNANVIGNYYYADPAYGHGGENGRALDIQQGTSGAVTSCYSHDNYSKDGSGIDGNVDAPFSVPSNAQIIATSPAEAFDYVKANVGCRVGGLDAFDQALIDDLTK